MKTFTSATCPNCQTLFESVPFDGDEDLYAALEITLCGDCGQALCRNCAQFACDGCAEVFCSEHMRQVDDLKCCPACAQEIEAQPPYELPAPKPARPELRPALVAKAVVA